METAEIRRRCIAHFEDARPHRGAVGLAALDDPNLLFVNAGMVPFMPYFLGQETPPYKRAVSVQKCVRTLDIEEVGKTTRHGTFFQMNGNFSFGDYFKEGAIELAWDLVTQPRPTAATASPEAELWRPSTRTTTRRSALWKRIAGLPDERIVRLGQEGELLVDGRPRPGRPVQRDPDRPRPGVRRATGTGSAGDRYLEFWNLVFMQDELARSAARTTSTPRSLPKQEHRHRHGPRAGGVPAAGLTTCTRSTRCSR